MAGILNLVRAGLGMLGRTLYSNSDFLIPLTKELRQHPVVRTLRTPLTQKFKDTYGAFSGKLQTQKTRHVPPNPENLTRGRLGIFDYLTLGIPRSLSTGLVKFANFLHSSDYPILKVLSYIPGGLGYLVHFVANVAARAVIAFAATVVVSPVVLVTHLVSLLVGAKQYKEALQLRGSNAQTTQPQTLSEFLAQTKVNANDLRLSNVSKETYQHHGTKMILFRLSTKGASGNNTPQFTFEVPAPQAQQQNGQRVAIEPAKAASLRATGRLNMFKMATRIQEVSEKVTYGNNTKAGDACEAFNEATRMQ